MGIRTYTCKETFQIEKYDDSGFYTGEEMSVEAGAMFQRTEAAPKILGNAGNIHLDGLTADEGTWLEISEDQLREYFEEFKKVDMPSY